MNQRAKQQMYKLHAQYCQALANPKRLEILDLLRTGELALEVLAKRLELKPPALSQHLAILKQKGLVATEKNGRKVSARLARPKIMQACDIFREVMFADIEEKRKLQKEFRKEV